MKTKAVKDFYNESTDYEWSRLAQDAFHKLEFDTTMHFLKKHLPKKGLILDAGGGPGRYTIAFAKLGYDVILFDLSPGLLAKAKKQIKKSGVEDNVKEVVQGSIEDLGAFKDEMFDITVCLGGPISHLETEKKRKKAVSELKRVTKKGGLVAISVIGRLAVLVLCSGFLHEEIEGTKHFKEMLLDGDDDRFRGKSFAHYFMPEEFIDLVNKSGIEIIEKVGLEGLSSHHEDKINELAKNKKAWKNWLEAHYKLCTHDAVFGTSGHLLIIGKV